MTDAPDARLLEQFVRNRSEEAFAELVQRHIGLVHSVALRHTVSPQHAEDITQAVFIILARKAGSLGHKTVLPGWLYHTARLVSANWQRAETRRVRREQEAFMQSTLEEPATNALWQELRPQLDQAMAILNPGERDAMVLRYFQNKSMAEVGQLLGLTENTAQKRVGRALEKLRKFFSKRGVTLTATLIAGAVSANSVQAAPVGLVKVVSAVAITKGTAAGTSTLTLVKGALKFMAWSNTKTAIVMVAAIICTAEVGAVVYEKHSVTASAKLKAALLINAPTQGTWGYPSERVVRAILDFGSNRADAFPILEDAVKGSNTEARLQAVAAMGLVWRPAVPQIGMLGKPATNAIPFLRQLLFKNGELSSFALSSLHGSFEAQDIPALADLLVESHGEDLSRKIASAPISRAQTLLDRANENEQLQRYLPQTIADIIQRNPQAVAPFISSVEDLLDHTNADVRFGAACALTKYLGVNDPRISRELKAGLKITNNTSAPNRTARFNPEDSLKQLMAVETLQSIGLDAKPLVPALLESANSAQDFVMREHTLAAVGYIDPNLRNTMPAVGQAVKNDPTFHNTTSTNSR